MFIASVRKYQTVKVLLCAVLIIIAGCTMVQNDSGNADAPNVTGAVTSREEINPLATPILPSATATIEAVVTAEAEKRVNKAAVVRESLWAQTAIGVCWDTPGFDTEKIWVRDAVARTWGLQSALEFMNWQQCNTNDDGIRITIDDVGPHVRFLGNRLNGLEEGMVLNFTFANWSSDFCLANENRRQFCIESIAVHEFGHAIGFAHEQNRPDAPEWCRDDPVCL